MRILIVEDIPDEAKLFTDIVAHYGHDPIVAATAEIALDRLTASSPDAVLLDMSLPGMSGLEFLQIARDRRPEMPIAAMSGLATEGEARRSLDLGAVEFLQKPFSMDRLRQVLDLLQAQLLAAQRSEDAQKVDRRRYPRAKISLEVTVEDLTGKQWQSHSVDLSPFGVKLRGAGNVQPRSTVRLSFSTPEGHCRINVLSLLVRKDPEGQAFAFIDLTGPDFHRLKTLVDTRLRLAS
ncbi:MAG: response regulator [Candidatus Rokubacteria bacterium]|nr:response regulator [Candidatus Rokubacteria bacterium]